MIQFILPIALIGGAYLLLKGSKPPILTMGVDNKIVRDGVILLSLPNQFGETIAVLGKDELVTITGAAVIPDITGKKYIMVTRKNGQTGHVLITDIAGV